MIARKSSFPRQPRSMERRNICRLMKIIPLRQLILTVRQSSWSKTFLETGRMMGAARRRCVISILLGAHVSGRIGEDPHDIPNNLMPYIAQVAIGKREALQIFGDDYETRDGTGERDYIHVTDLARAHIAALGNMSEADGFAVYNVGTGQGTTVKELLAAYGETVGRELPFETVQRRNGDVASSVASPKKANEALTWSATLSVHDATSSSWNWQSQNPDGYGQ
jgi:UDP-glucose 4-epimerase